MHRYGVVSQFYPWLKFYFPFLGVWLYVVMSLGKRKARAIWPLRKVKIKPWIKLNQNRYIFELVDSSSSNNRSHAVVN